MWKNNYSDARQLFQEYCAKDYPNIVTQKGTHIIDNDETTSVDYLYLQHPESKKLHILISGTHGVEGHAGSTIQFKTLDKPSFLFIVADKPKLYSVFSLKNALLKTSAPKW